MLLLKKNAVACLAVLMSAAAIAAPETPSSLTSQGLARVSSASPFLADCNGPAFPITAAYVNAEVEPYVAVNPRDPGNLIAVYQEDRYPNDGANGVLAAVSIDRGKTWQVPPLQDQPTISRCAGGNESNGGDFEKGSDPWVSIGPDGRAYFAAVAFNVSSAGMAEFVSISTDGGRSWSRPVVVIRDSDPAISDERPVVTADPKHPGVAYLVWDRHRSAPASKARSGIFFSRTTDGGKTWSRAHAIYETPIGLQTSANQIVVLPDGDLINVFNELKQGAGSSHPRHDRIAVIRSTDGGRRWSLPITVARSFVKGVVDPRTGQPVRVGDSFTDIAADPRPGTNTIYAIWGDARFTQAGTQGIALARSTDGGLTWSKPVAVTEDPEVQTFVPSIAVNMRGDVAVTYYSFATGKRDRQTLMTQYRVSLSDDGGRTWAPARDLTPEPFDLRTAPFNSGFFFGEYQGLTADGDSFVAVATFTNGRNLDNRTDIYACALDPQFVGRQDSALGVVCKK